MKLIRQLFTYPLIVALLVPGTFAAAQTVPAKAEPSLRQVQQQAQKDMAAFKNSHGSQLKDVLPAVLAFAPLFAAEFDPIKELYSYIAEIKANPSYFTGSEAQLKNLVSLQQFLSEKRYDEALTVFKKIDASTWHQFNTSSYFIKLSKLISVRIIFIYFIEFNSNSYIPQFCIS